jgi:hypothetical protein
MNFDIEKSPICGIGNTIALLESDVKLYQCMTIIVMNKWGYGKAKIFLRSKGYSSRNSARQYIHLEVFWLLRKAYQHMNGWVDVSNRYAGGI